MQFKNINKKQDSRDNNSNTGGQSTGGPGRVNEPHYDEPINEFSGDGGKLPLRIITLSGTEGVTKNMTLYECGEDIIAVDCGIGFPDSEMLGVDVVIPDMTYLKDNAHKVKGLFITHAHEDHIGAVPYLLREMNVPVYANKLVQGLIKERLKEKRFKDIDQNVSFHELTSEDVTVDVGCFKVSGFRVNHSVPSAMGIAIHTPQGLVLHMADYKIDWTPVLDKPIDLARIAKYGEAGVLCLLSDSLNVTTEGSSKSESTLNNTFQDLMQHGTDRQIMITTISSNLSRMHQIITAAIKHGRKVVLSGRSIETTVRVANSLGYLEFSDDVFVKESDVESHMQKDLVYIIAGCYGQQGSALDRVSRGEHQNIMLEDNALVVFSADPNPPGVAEAVEKIMDNLTLRGAEVIFSKIQANLHVSGHGTRDDLITVASVAKPAYFIPIGGTVTKNRAYKNMVGSIGFDRDTVFEMLEGESLVFKGGRASRGPTIDVKAVFVDGSNVGDIGPVVIKDREQLSNDGVFVVVVPLQNGVILKGKIEVITRGFIYVKESKQLMGRSKDMVNKLLDKNIESAEDWGNLRHKIERDVEKFLYKETGRNPLIIVHSINV